MKAGAVEACVGKTGVLDTGVLKAGVARAGGARRTIALIAAMGLAAAHLNAQVASEIQREYELRLARADRDSATVEDRVDAAEAARFLRRFEEAQFHLDVATMTAEDEGDRNLILVERLYLELARGGGVEGIQEMFRQERERREIPPVVLAGWANSYPELLVGGELDEVIGRLSEDADDPEYRCRCYAPKAWMHRAAGRMGESRVYWDSLVVSWERVPEFANQFDEADWRAQLARNLARAGRAEGSRVELERAMAVDVSAFESVSIRRRRAQTYAELGDVEKAVEDLEFLLTVPSPVTVHTLETRLTWEPIRETQAFQALLARHRKGAD